MRVFIQAPMEIYEHLENLKDNWDSYGGRATTSIALTKLDDLFRSIYITPSPDGGWILGLGDECTVECTPEGRLFSWMD